MKDKIPTTKITIGTHEAEVYNWLTQSEEDEYNRIMGYNELEQEFSVGGVPSELKMKVSLGKLNEANQYKLKTLMKSPTWDEFDIWEPEARAELVKRVDELTNKKK